MRRIFIALQTSARWIPGRKFGASNSIPRVVSLENFTQDTQYVSNHYAFSAVHPTMSCVGTSTSPDLHCVSLKIFGKKPTVTRNEQKNEWHERFDNEEWKQMYDHMWRPRKYSVLKPLDHGSV